MCFLQPPLLRHSILRKTSITIRFPRPSSRNLSTGIFAKIVDMSPIPPTTNPIIISGPSGVGKGTLYSRLLANHPSLFTTSISHTTRAPRPGEQRDVDYYYVSMEEFEAMIAAGDFVEHAKFGGNRYGTSRKMIERKRGEGKIVVLDIEMEGVKQIHALTPPFPARYVFISPPSTADLSPYQVLEKRLRGRGTEKEESIQKRLEQAKLELEYSKKEGVHDKIIVNDDLEVAYKELEDYIFGKGGKAADEKEAGISVQD
ncbi:hypothetical protein BPAE_0027g00200 [Botrytis paeoniae]|uniref:Guanylate kinase n=1 Tax=Botrytis paeoniae TaxID=278948 RepID=A0A4Z1G2B1_9HELO|nr:hypothetical protein BPAE_0027g00200 [Botrytis paeoniae]